MPDYSTLSRRQKTLSVAITARPSNGGLHLLVDSTGVKMLGEGEWKIKKHGADYRRQWRKVHLGVDAQTLEIRAIEVTDNANGDAPMLVSGTLEVALSHSKNTTGLTVHLDHGWHYKMQPYRAMLAQRGVTQSMSRKGNCFDNAVIENFLGTLKAEYYHLAKFDGVGALEAGVHDYIRYYNHERIKLNCKDSVRWITG